MKVSLFFALALCLSFVSISTRAEDGAEMLKSKGCVACHATDQKKVGPSVRDIAAKSKKESKDAQAIFDDLKASKKHPKSKATDDELKTIVAYIVSGR